MPIQQQTIGANNQANDIQRIVFSIYFIALLSFVVAVQLVFAVGMEQNRLAGIVSALFAGLYFFMGYKFQKHPTVIIATIYPIFFAIQMVGLIFLDKKYLFLAILLIFSEIYKTFLAYRSIKS